MEKQGEANESRIKKYELAMSLLAEQLNQSKQNTSRLEERIKSLEFALEKSFPIELYSLTRPDVAKWAENDKEKIIDHYIRRGINEIDIQSHTEHYTREIKTHYLQQARHITRDIVPWIHQNPKISEMDQVAQLNKTSNCPESLASNKEHNYAKQFTLIHINTNSICTWIPKNGCSALRFSIALANGAIDNIEDIAWIHSNNQTFAADNKELLQSKYSFIILRNPFKRLLSFFLDKCCHSTSASQNDKSYQHAREVFSINKLTTFESFVDTIWDKPSLIKKDNHTTPQCDFLIFKNYSDYFQFENFKFIEKTLRAKIGLEIKDTRRHNSIYTSKDSMYTEDINSKMCVGDIENLLVEGKRPLEEKMYTDEMITKVSALYISDIMLYISVLKNGEAELSPWLRRNKSY